MTLRQRRAAIVAEHIASENAHDFDATLATFASPRYEVTPTSEALDGAVAVKSFLLETYHAFPDMGFDTRAMHHSDEAVIVETTFTGTHLGQWRGLSPTRRAVRYSMCNVFQFAGEGLVCERLNFDMLTILRQLGIADDPTSMRGRLRIALCHPIRSTSWSPIRASSAFSATVDGGATVPCSGSCVSSWARCRRGTRRARPRSGTWRVPVEATPGRKRVNTDDLASAVARALHDPSYAQNARRAGDRLLSEGGASRAADLIGQVET